jgi:peptidoglycan/LPS O-acetylase OafA/YrhL
MLPEQLKEFGETLLSIIFLSSNIYFWYKDDGYFSQLSELNPLVHTWSLAVEEQFYFLFPILCFLFYRKKIYFIILLICLSGFSLFLAQWGGNFQSMTIEQLQLFSQHRFASFYLPFGRIWELLLGTFLAFYLQSNDSTKYVLSFVSYLR